MIRKRDFVGHWKATIYNRDGRPLEQSLLLRDDGKYIWKMTVAGKPSRESGSWRFLRKRNTLGFLPTSKKKSKYAFWILAIEMCEDSNLVLMLRWAGLASRNLPMLFYRVFN